MGYVFFTLECLLINMYDQQKQKITRNVLHTWTVLGHGENRYMSFGYCKSPLHPLPCVAPQ